METLPIAVLVVEDEVLIRMVIVDVLEEQGFKVFEAGTADQAISILVSTPEVQVLFTDIDMPGGMDGLKLAAAVRDRWPPIQIIVTSGHRRVSLRAVFFGKPYDPQRICAKVSELAT